MIPVLQKLHGNEAKTGTNNDALAHYANGKPTDRRGTTCLAVRSDSLFAVVDPFIDDFITPVPDFSAVATLYSYTTPIATRIRRADGAERDLIVTESIYSFTTTGHARTARSYVGSMRAWDSVFGAHIALQSTAQAHATALSAAAIAALNQALRARLPSRARWAFDSYAAYVRQAAELREFFQLPRIEELPHRQLGDKLTTKFVAARLNGLVPDTVANLQGIID